ncbi:MAG TPA: ABC transporter permease subunit [Thermoanaerobacterales bacterium]|nr:ABC transporter permease subunit [Thermoanaerobacterales bacterium]
MKDIFGIEILKLKNSKILWIALLAPAFIVIQGGLNLIRYYDLFTGKGQNVWAQLYTQSMIFYVSILYPILISIIITLIARIENLNSCWKYYLSLPVDKGKIYVVKFIIGCAMMFIDVAAFIISVIAVGMLMGIKGPVPFDVILIKPLMAYFASLPIIAVIYVLSIRFSQMALPLGVGISLTLPAMLVANTRYWVIYPWSYPIMAALGGDFDVFDKGSLTFLISFVLLLAVFSCGYVSFKKRDIE